MTVSHGRPTARELVDAVAEFLRGEVLPDGVPANAFGLRVALNALAMVSRELAGDGATAVGAAIRLGYPDDAALAVAIRAGDFDRRLDELVAAVTDDVQARLRVSAPDFADRYRADDFAVP